MEEYLEISANTTKAFEPQYGFWESILQLLLYIYHRTYVQDNPLENYYSKKLETIQVSQSRGLVNWTMVHPDSGI